MKSLDELLSQNKNWAESMVKSDPMFFQRLAHQQSPELLWIGCSDSRVPANQIAGVLPGSIFVHRNVANVVSHDDKNCLAVLQYGIDVLRVRHVLVVGHYQCGGVRAVLDNRQLGLISDWLKPIEPVRNRFRRELDQIPTEAQWDVLCELNVIAQAKSVAETKVVQDAWQRHQELWVHGWIYGVHDGRLRDLDVTLGAGDEVKAVVEQSFRAAFDGRRAQDSRQQA